MPLNVGQMAIFLQYALLGVIIGALYTAAWTVRQILGGGKFAQILTDLAFWAGVAVATAIGSTLINNAALRAYTIFGLCLGAWAYLATVQKLLDKTLSAILARLNKRLQNKKKKAAGEEETTAQ